VYGISAAGAVIATVGGGARLTGSFPETRLLSSATYEENKDAQKLEDESFGI
jgi:hypothetical protein